MKTIVKGCELSGAVNKVSKAISSKSPNQLLEGIKLSVKGDSLVLTATDMEIAIEKTITAETYQEGDIVVPGRLFADFVKKLEIVGVGYRAAMEGKNLNMALGYSHPVIVEAPEGITFAVEANTKITVTGTNKQAVGDIAATIRGKRPPEVHKGKGVKYEGEYIRRKAG